LEQAFFYWHLGTASTGSASHPCPVMWCLLDSWKLVRVCWVAYFLWAIAQVAVHDSGISCNLLLANWDGCY